MTRSQKQLIATTEQFNKGVLRLMPTWATAIPEGALVASVLTQAWLDGSTWFFAQGSEELRFLCGLVDIDPDFISRLYRDYNKHARKQGI